MLKLSCGKIIYPLYRSGFLQLWSDWADGSIFNPHYMGELESADLHNFWVNRVKTFILIPADDVRTGGGGAECDQYYVETRHPCHTCHAPHVTCHELEVTSKHHNSTLAMTLACL